MSRVAHLVVPNGVRVIPEESSQNPREDQQDPQVSPADLRSPWSEHGMRVEQFQSPVSKSRSLDLPYYRAYLLPGDVEGPLRALGGHFAIVRGCHGIGGLKGFASFRSIARIQFLFISKARDFVYRTCS